MADAAYLDPYRLDPRLRPLGAPPPTPPRGLPVLRRRGGVIEGVEFTPEESAVDCTIWNRAMYLRNVSAESVSPTFIRTAPVPQGYVFWVFACSVFVAPSVQLNLGLYLVPPGFGEPVFAAAELPQARGGVQLAIEQPYLDPTIFFTVPIIYAMMKNCSVIVPPGWTLLAGEADVANAGNPHVVGIDFAFIRLRDGETPPGM